MNFTNVTIKSWRTTAARLLLTGRMHLPVIHATIAAPMGADYFPNAALVNQDGKTLHFYDDVIKGKVVTINFMFTSCGDSCPLETAKLREVQKLLGDHVGKDVHMYSISIDPERDTPAVLKAYMKRFNIGPGWQFLTGKQEDIDRIRKKLGMYADDETELSDHNINFIVGNEATGQWLKRTPFDVPQSQVAVLLGRLQTRPLNISGMQQHNYARAKSIRAAGEGEEVFLSRCSTCHTIGQGQSGGKLGPDLLGVSSHRDRLWLIRWLQEPDVMLKEKDPLATALYNRYNQVPMPNLRLSHTTVLHLIEYMQQESRRVKAIAAGMLRPQTGQLEHIVESTVHRPTPFIQSQAEAAASTQ